MKIIANTMTVTSPKEGGTGYRPCRFEVIDNDDHYTVHMVGWNGQEWTPYYPCCWQAEKSDISLPTAIHVMEGEFKNHVLGLLRCEYVFSVTKEK